MASPIPQEVKAKILSSIEDDGVSIAEASTTYNVTEETLRKWLRATIDNGGSSTSEIQRLRRENQQLKEIIGHLLRTSRRPGDPPPAGSRIGTAGSVTQANESSMKPGRFRRWCGGLSRRSSRDIDVAIVITLRAALVRGEEC